MKSPSGDPKMNPLGCSCCILLLRSSVMHQTRGLRCSPDNEVRYIHNKTFLYFMFRFVAYFQMEMLGFDVSCCLFYQNLKFIVNVNAFLPPTPQYLFVTFLNKWECLIMALLSRKVCFCICFKSTCFPKNMLNVRKITVIIKMPFFQYRN